MDERSDQEDLTCGEAVEIGKELSENLWFNGSMKLERSMKKKEEINKVKKNKI